MGGRRVRCRRTGLRSRICSTCLQRSAGVECSLTPKGDLPANQGVMAMSREGASAPYWRYRSGREKLTTSTSRTAARSHSVAPAVAIAALRFARCGLARRTSGALALTTTYLKNLNLLRSKASTHHFYSTSQPRLLRCTRPGRARGKRYRLRQPSPSARSYLWTPSSARVFPFARMIMLLGKRG